MSLTLTLLGDDDADCRWTVYVRSNGTPALAYSTSSSNSTLIAGTAASGLRTSPRAGSATRLITGATVVTIGVPAIVSETCARVSAIRSSPIAMFSAAVEPLPGGMNMSPRRPTAIHHGWLATGGRIVTVARPALSGGTSTRWPFGVDTTSSFAQTDTP